MIATNQVDSLLITGATGFVGGQLLLQLRARDADRPIIALVRQPERLPPVPNVTVIQGDISLPNLGLAEEMYNGLKEHVTAIIHAAADVRFSTSLEAARSVNTEGTGRVLRFAFDCPNLDRFAHISTVFVAGRMVGEIGEEEYVATHHTSANRHVREFLRLSGLFLPYLTLYQCFQRQRTTATLEASGCSLPPIRDYLPKVLAYCAKHWGKRRRRS